MVISKSIANSEEFLGLAALSAINREAMSKHILKKNEEFKLDIEKLVDQGFNGCSTLAEEIRNVRKRISKQLKATYTLNQSKSML